MPSGKDGGQLPRAREATARQPIKVLICDASGVVRNGLVRMLASDDGIAVVAEASSAEHVVAVVQEPSAAVVIGDPHQLGAEAITALLAAGVKVLVVSYRRGATPDAGDPLRVLGLRRSARDQARRPTPARSPGGEGPPRMVGVCLRARAAVPPAERRGVERARVRRTHRSGPQQARTAGAPSHRTRPDEQGDAQMLGLHESTVKTHVLHIYEKLEVRTRLDLISLAIERGWVQNAAGAGRPLPR